VIYTFIALVLLYLLVGLWIIVKKSTFLNPYPGKKKNYILAVIFVPLWPILLGFAAKK
jgi:hypothetical protein